MDEEKDLSSNDEINANDSDNSSSNDTPADEQNTDDVGNDEVDSGSKVGNGYNGLASSNREAYARGLTENYNDRIARNRAALNESRARAADPNKMKKGHEDEEMTTDEETGESNFKEKNILDKARDRGDVLRSKSELISSKIDSARSKAFEVMHPGEAAKMALKAKIKAMLIPALIPICFGLMFVFVVFVVVLLVTGLFEGSSSVSSGGAISSIYSECNSVNVEGKLYSLDDYIAGVVQHEAYLSEGEEALKAQAIAARTYALKRTDGCTKAIANSTSAQTFSSNPSETAKKASSDTAGLVLTYNGDIFSAQYDSFCYADGDCPDAKKNSDGSYTVTYTKLPNNEKHKITLSDSSMYGRIVRGGGHARGMSQLVSYQLAKEGKSYDQILKYFYSDGVQISSLTSESTSGGASGGTVSDKSGKYYVGTYSDNSTGKTYYNYKQTLYGGWIAQSGCLLTSAAIIINADNRSVTPEYLYTNYRKKVGYVNAASYFSDYNFKIVYDGSGKVSSMKSKIISNINNGGTAIFKVTSGCNINGTSWTSRQHFFAVLDYDSSSDKFYVSNPGSSKSNKNGWISADKFSCATVRFLVKSKG